MIKMDSTVAVIIKKDETKAVRHNQPADRLPFAHLDSWEPNTFQFSKQISDGDEIIFQQSWLMVLVE